MDTRSLAKVEWSPAVNSHFEVLRLKHLHNRELPDDHNPWQPHRLQFHALILFTQGQGTHGIDGVEYPVKVGTLIHICANQVHHFGSAPELDAFMVVFVPTALPTQFLGLSTNISSPLSWSTIQYVWPSITSLELEPAQILQQHIEVLETHQIMGSQPHSAAQYLLWAVIAFASQAAVESNQHHLAKTIDPRFLEFVELLEQFYESCRNMKWYAAQMNCSAKTLYRICVTAAGKSPKTMTDERVAVEAQRRLLFGQTTVQEVGTSLGFEETTNFVKFFRRLVGQNPDEFRLASGL